MPKNNCDNQHPLENIVTWVFWLLTLGLLIYLVSLPDRSNVIPSKQEPVTIAPAQTVTAAPVTMTAAPVTMTAAPINITITNPPQIEQKPIEHPPKVIVKKIYLTKLKYVKTKPRYVKVFVKQKLRPQQCYICRRRFDHYGYYR